MTEHSQVRLFKQMTIIYIIALYVLIYGWTHLEPALMTLPTFLFGVVSWGYVIVVYYTILEVIRGRELQLRCMIGLHDYVICRLTPPYGEHMKVCKRCKDFSIIRHQKMENGGI